MSRSFSLLLTCTLLLLPSFVYCQVINVASQEEFGKLINNKNLAVIKFYTSWCGACTATKEPLEQISELPQMNDVLFAEIDIDQIPEVKDIYDIRYIPSTLFFKKGKMIDQHTPNNMSTYKEEIIDRINRLQPNAELIIAIPEKSHEKNLLQTFFSYLMIPVYFFMNLIERLFQYIIGFFS